MLNFILALTIGGSGIILVLNHQNKIEFKKIAALFVLLIGCIILFGRIFQPIFYKQGQIDYLNGKINLNIVYEEKFNGEVIVKDTICTKKFD